jgi:D-alanyl-D-alanine carboxypeptidase
MLIGRLMTDHPDSRTMLGGQTFIYAGRVYARRISLFNDPGGVQALKTGFTNEAGYNLAVSAWRSGQQFLMIILGARTRQLSFLDGKKLLVNGFVELGLQAPAPERTRTVTTKTPQKIRTRRASLARTR